jgi:hypothetical protein
MGIGGRKLHTDAQSSAHLAGDISLKDRIRVELEDRCERARMGVMVCMQVLDFQRDGLRHKACAVFGLKEPYPLVVCMVANNEQAIAEAMWGGDMNMTPKVRGHVEKGTGWFRASTSVAWWSSGLVERA